MPCGMEVGLRPGNIVLDGDPAPPSQKGRHSLPLQFSAHVCDQTAGWIKMPLGTKVGLGPGHIVLHGDPAYPPRGTALNFWPMSIVAKQPPISAIAELLLKMSYEEKLNKLYLTILETRTPRKFNRSS